MSYVATTLLLFSAALGQTEDARQPPAIVGTWETIDRHVSIGSLYQPVHGVRKRQAVVRFQHEGDQLSGYAICAHHKEIVFQERWKDGRTDFRQAAFADDKLKFEFDIGEWRKDAGPLAVEEGRLENSGKIRVEATLQGDRLVGTWKMYVADGTEVFRGEWEAWRALGAPAESGPVMLIGGRHQDLTDEIRKQFFELAGGKKARMVIIPTAIASPEKPETQLELRQPWLDLGPQSVEILHTRDPKTADDPAFVKPLTEATAVFFTNGHQHRIFDAYRGTLVEKELLKLQARGGLVGGTGTGAVVLGEQVLLRPIQDELIAPGLGLLLGLTVEDERDAERFPGAVAVNPHYVGLLVEPGTAAVIRGHKMNVLGEAVVTVRLATSAGKESKIEVFKAGAECDLLKLRTQAAQQK